MLFFIGTKGQEDGLRLLQQSCVHKHDILDPVVLVESKSKSLDVLEEICYVSVLCLNCSLLRWLHLITSEQNYEYW